MAMYDEHGEVSRIVRKYDELGWLYGRQVDHDKFTIPRKEGDSMGLTKCKVLSCMDAPEYARILCRK